ncbi:MAG: DUF2796 domain-containing protein [Steroidobacteraceae bacterium]
MPRFRTGSLSVLGVVTALVAARLALSADELAAQHVHQHGHVTANVALDGSRLTLEIEVPAINVVGFERAPRDAAERGRVATPRTAGSPPRRRAARRATRSRLQARARRLQRPAPAAGTDSNLAAAAGAAAAPNAGAHEDHGDYEIRVSFDCANRPPSPGSTSGSCSAWLQVAEVASTCSTPALQTQRRLGARRAPRRPALRPQHA